MKYSCACCYTCVLYTWLFPGLRYTIDKKSKPHQTHRRVFNRGIHCIFGQYESSLQEKSLEGSQCHIVVEKGGSPSRHVRDKHPMHDTLASGPPRRTLPQVERLKGLQLKFTAFYKLLLEYPHLADKIVLLQVGVAGRPALWTGLVAGGCCLQFFAMAGRVEACIDRLGGGGNTERRRVYLVRVCGAVH